MRKKLFWILLCNFRIPYRRLALSHSWYSTKKAMYGTFLYINISCFAETIQNMRTCEFMKLLIIYSKTSRWFIYNQRKKAVRHFFPLGLGFFMTTTRIQPNLSYVVKATTILHALRSTVDARVRVCRRAYTNTYTESSITLYAPLQKSPLAFGFFHHVPRIQPQFTVFHLLLCIYDHPNNWHT